MAGKFCLKLLTLITVAESVIDQKLCRYKASNHLIIHKVYQGGGNEVDMLLLSDPKGGTGESQFFKKRLQNILKTNNY